MARGRKAGSKDSKPRVRRTKEQIERGISKTDITPIINPTDTLTIGVSANV